MLRLKSNHDKTKTVKGRGRKTTGPGILCDAFINATKDPKIAGLPNQRIALVLYCGSLIATVWDEFQTAGGRNEKSKCRNISDRGLSHLQLSGVRLWWWLRRRLIRQVFAGQR